MNSFSGNVGLSPFTDVQNSEVKKLLQEDDSNFLLFNHRLYCIRHKENIINVLTFFYYL